MKHSWVNFNKLSKELINKLNVLGPKSLGLISQISFAIWSVGKNLVAVALHTGISIKNVNVVKMMKLYLQIFYEGGLFGFNC